MGDFTTFLFARPSFSEGVARLVDFGGTLNEYNTSPSGAEADRLALWADWAAVGNDMNEALLSELRESIRETERSKNVQAIKKAEATG